ncbi:DUF397 domain-containing protein [Streptomyces griseoloalbus]|uniref:DUF397 domain-containing protein n=1 Tax=Streptomyces griseoloalbus TaxID=67303 RepID=UPI0033BF4E45
MTDTPWHQASYSEQAANCLQSAAVDGDVLVRESDEPDTVVRTTRAKLTAFLAGVKARVSSVSCSGPRPPPTGRKMGRMPVRKPSTCVSTSA